MEPKGRGRKDCSPTTTKGEHPAGGPGAREPRWDVDYSSEWKWSFAVPPDGLATIGREERMHRRSALSSDGLKHGATLSK